MNYSLAEIISFIVIFGPLFFLMCVFLLFMINKKQFILDKDSLSKQERKHLLLIRIHFVIAFTLALLFYLPFSPVKLYNFGVVTHDTILEEYSPSEIESFNNQFENYKGESNMDQVSALCGYLIANAKTYNEDSVKVPNVYLRSKSDLNSSLANSDDNTLISVTYDRVNEDDLNRYVAIMGEIKKNLTNQITYNISFNYNDIGFISEVIIEY